MRATARLPSPFSLLAPDPNLPAPPPRTVTNTIVAMVQMGDGDELLRAFAGACVHDCFNL